MSTAAPPRAARANAPAPATPRADAVLRPLATPPGLAAWLRARERDLLAARARADAAIREAVDRGERPCASLREAADEIARALDDPRTGALPRLLQRPIRQLIPGTTVCTRFERAADRLIARVDQAVRLQPAVGRVWERRRALDAEYGERFPSLLQREITEARVDGPDVDRLRTTDDAEATLGRLERVAARMAAWRDEVRGDPWSTVELDPGARLTVSELGALTARGLRERTRLATAHTRAGRLRERLAHHAAEARALAPRDGTPAGPADVVHELLLTAARTSGGNAIGAADAPLWSWVFGGEQRTHLAAWSESDATQLPPPPPELPASGETLYVVPVGTDGGGDVLAWVTPVVRSAVRVWNAEPRLGGAIEGRVMLADDAGFDPVVEHDLAALYDGVALPRSAWYQTVREVHLTLIARRGNSWVARVTRRGVASPTAAPAWSATAPAPDQFRLLRPAPARPRRDAPTDVQGTRGTGHAFAGASTTEVRTAYAADGIAWLRAPATGEPGNRAVLDREAALFEELARHERSARAAITPIGYARRTPHEVPLPLYRRPLATGPGLGEHLAAVWLRDREARLALVAAIARAIVAVHAAEVALGIVHPDAFAYTLAYDLDAKALVPRAILTYAPCATPFGQPFDRAWLRGLETRGVDPRLPRLRRSALPPADTHATASRGGDALTFVRCALDLLAVEPLPVASGRSASPLTTLIAAYRDYFAEPDIAARLARLVDGGEADRAVTLLDAVAAASTAEQLLHVFTAHPLEPTPPRSRATPPREAPAQTDPAATPAATDSANQSSPPPADAPPAAGGATSPESTGPSTDAPSGTAPPGTAPSGTAPSSEAPSVPPLPIGPESARSIEQLIALCDRRPDEAQQAFTSGTMARWLDVRHVTWAAYAARDRHRHHANEPAKALELFVRDLSRHVGRPAAPVLTPAPAECVLGVLPTGTQQTARITLGCETRPFVWGSIRLEPALPGVTVPSTFGGDRSAVASFEVAVDTTHTPPGDYAADILVEPVGGERVAVPLRYTVGLPTPVRGARPAIGRWVGGLAAAGGAGMFLARRLLLPGEGWHLSYPWASHGPSAAVAGATVLLVGSAVTTVLRRLRKP